MAQAYGKAAYIGDANLAEGSGSRPGSQPRASDAQPWLGI